MNADEAHRLLGVSRGVSPEDLKKAFKKKAFEYHPDRNNGSAHANKMFTKVTEAYDTISSGGGWESHTSEDARRAWDEVNDRFREHFPSGSPPSSESDFVEMFSSIFGQYLDDRVPGGFRTRVERVVRDINPEGGVGGGVRNRKSEGEKKAKCPRCGHRGGGGRIVVNQGFRSVTIKCPRCG